MLFGDGLDAARAELHLVTPREQAVERRLQVRFAPAARKELPADAFLTVDGTRKESVLFFTKDDSELVKAGALRALKQLAKQ